MITIHIGLPRTASTYIQEKIFENTHIKKYLPKTLKGNYVSRILSSNNSNKIKKLIYLIQKKKNHNNNQNIIISEENLSVKLSKKKTSLMEDLFNKKIKEFNIDKHNNYNNFLIYEAQILR